jgi:DNA-binding transcriptional MerR regulator
MGRLLSIGRFATLSGISVKALRHYDELGLLRPAQVDAATGYRYYEASQAEVAEQIRLLRSVDLPLDEIRAFLAADEGRRRGVLEGQRDALEARLAAGRDALENLERLLRGPVEQSGAYAVSTRSIPPQWVVGIRQQVVAAEVSSVIGAGFFTLYRALALGGAQPAGPGMTLFYGLGEEEEERADLEIAVPLAGLAGPFDGFTVHELPAVRVASATHAGPYEGLGACHQALVRWATRGGVALGEPQRNVYTVSPAQTVDPAHLRTEVLWPISER